MNMQNLMAQAQKMQRDMLKKKEELVSKEFTGKSELVTVVFNGNKELVSIDIKKESSYEPDDVEILEDMLKIAINDALTQVEKASEEIMGDVGGLGGMF